MNYRRRLQIARRVAAAGFLIAALAAIYLSTPPECFEDGPLPRYCVEG